MKHRVLVAFAVMVMAFATGLSSAQSTAPREPNVASATDKSQDDAARREARRERHHHRQAIQHRHRRKH